MNRVELKEKAKKMIAGNKWYLWKPLVIVELILCAIFFVIAFILGLCGLEEKTVTTITSIVSVPISIFETAFMVGYAKYCLDFVRGKKTEWKETIQFAKEHWIICFCVSFLIGLMVVGGSILLVIPGIIIAIGHMFYQEVCADNPNLKTMEIIKKSWAITKNHKMDLFVLGLSFIGWVILAELTLGILFIWLYPYMIVTMILAYEELKKTA